MGLKKSAPFKRKGYVVAKLQNVTLESVSLPPPLSSRAILSKLFKLAEP